MNADASDGVAPAVGSSSPPISSPSPLLPQWLWNVTHVVALGWATAELALWGGRPQSLSFIGLILLAGNGRRVAAQLRAALGTGTT